MKLEKDTRISHYKILSSIGKGGMGEVFLAQDTRLDRKVALKILLAEFAEDADRMSRFVREAKSASALNHPNIITIYEIGESDGTHFIATEFIDGKTLGDYKKVNSLDYKSALEIAIQVASALDEAHSAGIVHRDIKPDNIMVRANGLAKILDFGIAKLSAPTETGEEAATAIQSQTQAGMIIGTPNYMSPEQAKGQAVDARSDIFSFGVVLYELLSGKLPFAGETAMETIAAIINKEPLPLSAKVPPEIERIISQTLRKERGERYQTIKDLLIDLKDVKLELDVRHKSDKTVSPDQEEEPKTQILQAAATAEEANQTITAKNLNDSISIKKSNVSKALIGVFALMLIAAVGAGYWFYRGNNSKQIESIAVMPFVNESGNADVEYLSDGMTETLINSLSQVPNLNVKARSSVFRYKGKEFDPKKIAAELNVQAILTGRIIQRGEQMTLNLELIDAQTENVLWGNKYERKSSDLVSLQSEIARDVSTNLKAKLSGAEETKITKTGTADTEAYQAYLKGRYYWNRRTAENLKKAIEQFKIAADRDPNYALAFVGLADCYALLNQYAGTPTSETAPPARAYAERALSIDTQLAEPHADLGQINEQLWQWSEAEREYKRAIELNPNYATAYHWYSILLNTLGRSDESLAMIQRASELDPLSGSISAALSWVMQSQNNHQAAIENSLKLIELDPNFGPAYDTLGLSYLKTGRYTEAVTAMEKSAQLTNRYGLALSDLGYAYAATGKRPEAIAVIKELELKYARKEANGQNIAAVYAGLGDKDKAFEWLEKDYQNRDGFLSDIKRSIPLESLRDDPRYKDLLKRMNLPE